MGKRKEERRGRKKEGESRMKTTHPLHGANKREGGEGRKAHIPEEL
jgi:hypothetical protein